MKVYIMFAYIETVGGGQNYVNGKPSYFQMIGDRNFETHDGRLAFYDMNWNLCEKMFKTNKS